MLGLANPWGLLARASIAVLIALTGVLSTRALPAQSDPGAALWRVVAQTLAIPPALAQGTGSILWNPAQPGSARFALALDAVQGATEVGATGVVGAARARPGRLGTVTVLYGHMQIGDLVRISTSPIPDPGVIEYQTQLVGLGWAATVGQATIGATGARHTTTLDTIDA